MFGKHSLACGRAAGFGGVCGREGLLRGRGRHGRLRSTACGRHPADGDHELRRHDVVAVMAHATLLEAVPNRDRAFLPEASVDEHHVARHLRVRGEDLPV